ncbi:MAG TPA: DnaB-like helicase C-terminal domain-containing protein [Gemmatimonadales bacterium]|nr:DnaB-like helicase C-terminal domain-containing protein [Gemmatimonadales bacterium]
MPKTEHRLNTKMTYEVATDTVLDAGITADMFQGERDRQVFERHCEFLQKYGRPATAVVIRNEFPGYLKNGNVEEPLEYLIDQMIKDYKQRLLYLGGDEIATALENNDPDEALEVVARIVRDTSGMDAGSKTVTLGSKKLMEMLQLWKSRADAPDGLIGIDTGFDTINKATLGFQPSQLVTIAGLGGAGKSTLLMMMARTAQKQGRRPYFMSFEMGEEEQFGRYMSMATGIPYRKIVSGRFDPDEEERYIAEAQRADDQSIFTLCTDVARGSTVSKLEAELRKRDLPEVAFIDGVYFMRDEQTKMPGTDWQALTNITRGLKQLAQRMEIPIVISTQALPSKARKKNGHSRLDMYSAGYSSSFAQDSDVMFGLEEDPGQPSTRILRVTKARHCAPHTVRIEWDWRRSSFGDFIEMLEGGDEDDDGGERYDDEDDDVA